MTTSKRSLPAGASAPARPSIPLAQEYQITVGSAQDYLARADELDGFLFAAAEGENLNATIGTNEESENTLWLDRLLGVLILGIANTHDIHPAEIGHLATQFAREHMEE